MRHAFWILVALFSGWFFLFLHTICFGIVLPMQGKQKIIPTLLLEFTFSFLRDSMKTMKEITKCFHKADPQRPPIGEKLGETMQLLLDRQMFAFLEVIKNI